MNPTTEIQDIPLTVEKDFLQRISSTGPVKALAELIWNGLDSGSPVVDVQFTKNHLGEIDEIRVIDKGEGIPHDEAPSLFGKLGDSWKKQMGRKHGRALHGKNGQGEAPCLLFGKPSCVAHQLLEGREGFRLQAVRQRQRTDPYACHFARFREIFRNGNDGRGQRNQRQPRSPYLGAY